MCISFSKDHFFLAVHYENRYNQLNLTRRSEQSDLDLMYYIIGMDIEKLVQRNSMFFMCYHHLQFRRVRFS